MKKHLTFIIAIIFCIQVYSQNEFQVYPNGLIYSKGTMAKLSHIVDSLNLKFKTCDLNKVFYSKYQTVSHIITLKKGDIKAARRDMDQQIELDEFLKKYPEATIEEQALVIKSKYKNYEDKYIVEFEHFDFTSDYGFNIQSNDTSLFEKDLKNKWLYEYYEKTSYSEEYIKAFYFPEQFVSISIPQKYAQMIGYSDCLVDTTTTKFREDMESGWVELPKNWHRLPESEKSALLEKMRRTRVIGGCSMDSRPREHAVNIALLSAETANWEVFLKAHLDIMNDRFERMSDGSYAWAQRKTYIKELEELNINVSDLLMGICFRVENPAKNHYYGKIGRLGRALAETNNRKEIEENILSAVSDSQLDDYNRALFYFLFLNYNNYLQDENIKKGNQEKLDQVIKKLPDHMKNKLLQK